MDNNDAESEDMKRLLGENMVRMVYKDYYEKMREHAEEVGWENIYKENPFVGSLLGGVIYMTQEEIDTLYEKVLTFVQAHTAFGGENTIPIEYSLIAFNSQKKEKNSK